MERASRLRRYQRKDYTQLVDFPVEIVGRDGQVRRYSFDESVRLYQRRIRSAAVRYDDSELIDAESRHCRSRIDQLRRSYVERFGWGGVREGLAEGVLATTLAADVVAFLRRVFPEGRNGPPSLQRVGAGVCDVWWVGVDDHGFLLYLYRLDGPEAGQARDALRLQLRQLASAPAADSVERLFAVQEGPDLAIVLTGTGAWDGPVIAGPSDEEIAQLDADTDPWVAGLRALHDGAIAEAVRIFDRGLEAQPGRRVLPQAAALLALLDGQAPRAEFAARFGRLAHPQDGLLAWLHALALARQGRTREASRLLTALPTKLREDPMVRVLRATLDVAAGRVLSGVARLVALEGEPLVLAAERTRRWLLDLLLPGLSVALAAFVAAPLLPGPWSAGPTEAPGRWALVALGVFVASVTVTVARLRATAVLLGRTRAEFRLATLDLLPREGDAAREN